MKETQAKILGVAREKKFKGTNANIVNQILVPEKEAWKSISDKGW